MRKKLLLALVTVAAIGTSFPADVARSLPAAKDGHRPAVFIMTNDPTGNEVVVYRRAADGTLEERRSYPTRGLGGIAQGAVSDPLASQDSLVYAPRRSMLIASNAGSDTITVFEVDGLRLRFVQELASGGQFPVSIAVHGELVYVLNAGGDGSIAGFRIDGGKLRALARSTRSLELGNTTPPDFLMSPAEVGFSPGGSHLIVTTKGNGTIEVYGVRANGRPTADSVSTPNAGGPFAFLFDGGRLLVTEAVTAAVTSYRLEDDGQLALLEGPVANGQAATCWIVEAGGHLIVSNTASNTLSSYTGEGPLALLEGVATPTDVGPIDMAVTPDGETLFLQNGVDQSIQAFSVAEDGMLTLIATTPGPPKTDGVPFEGIVVT